MTYTITPHVQELAELSELDQADNIHYEINRRTVYAFHATSMLHQCAEDIAVGLVGETKVWEFQIHDDDCEQDADSRKLWFEPGSALVEALRERVFPEVTEVIRSVHLYVRGVDFALMALIAEPQGYVHTGVTAPVMFKPLPLVGVQAGDVVTNGLVRICQQPEIWGGAWDHIPCNHAPQPEEHHHEEE